MVVPTTEARMICHRATPRSSSLTPCEVSVGCVDIESTLVRVMEPRRVPSSLVGPGRQLGKQAKGIARSTGASKPAALLPLDGSQASARIDGSSWFGGELGDLAGFMCGDGLFHFHRL